MSDSNVNLSDWYEERRQKLRRLAESDDFSLVVIRNAAGAEIPGVFLDLSDDGVGIAISTYEPLQVGDSVVVENLGTQLKGTVKHITSDQVVQVGIEVTQFLSR